MHAFQVEAVADSSGRRNGLTEVATIRDWGEIGWRRELVDLPAEPKPIERAGIAIASYRPASGTIAHGDPQPFGEIAYPDRAIDVAVPHNCRPVQMGATATATATLAESIRMHPGQEELKVMMKTVGYRHVDVQKLAAGSVAPHVGGRAL